MRFRYVGATEQLFPTLGLALRPGDEVELAADPGHPDLRPVEEPSAPAEAPARASRKGDKS